MDYKQVSRACRNIDVIARYLRQHFGDCTVQVVEQPPIFVRFLLSNAVTGERFVLGVFWPTLGDRNNTPERIANKMKDEDLAGNLRITREYIWDHNAKPTLHEGESANDDGLGSSQWLPNHPGCFFLGKPPRSGAVT